MIRTEDPNFIRDEHSRALINTNVTAYKLYKSQRSNIGQVQSMEKEMNKLRDEVEELRKLIKDIVREKNGNTNF